VSNVAGLSALDNPFLITPSLTYFVNPHSDARIVINGKIGNHQKCINVIEGKIVNTLRCISCCSRW
jgi:hypothetical protein